MKNFNKDNSMKKFKCFLGMATLALTLVGNAIAAEPAMPAVPSEAPMITVTSVAEWKGIQNKVAQLSTAEKNLVIKVSGDIEFSSNIGMPWSEAPSTLNTTIDFGQRNIYIVGDETVSSNSLTGIHLKGAGASLFKNVDTVYIENVDLKNCYLLAEVDDSHNSAAFLAPRAKGVYLNKVTLENVGVKGVPDIDGKTPVFSTAAFLVDTTSCNGASCGAFVFQDVSVNGLTIDSLRSVRTGGFIAYASGSVSVQSSQLKNVSVNFSTDDPNWAASSVSSVYLGGVVAEITSVASLYIQNSSIELAPLKFESVDLESFFIYMGGVVGSLEVGSIQLEKSTFSGNIDIVNNNLDGAGVPLKPRVGGVAGYWMPKSNTPTLNLQMEECVSTVDITTNLEIPIIVSGTYDEELDFSFSSAFGGFFGSMIPSVNSLAGVINRSTYSGKIDYKTKAESFTTIGGFIGIWGNGSITFNDNVVNGSGISYQGPYSAIGALVGTVKNTKAGVFVNNLEVDNAIEASISPAEGISVGGVFGLAINSPVALNGVSIKSEISVNDATAFSPSLAHSIDLSMGGAIGYIGNSDSLQMQNVSYEGSLSSDRYYASIKKTQYVGGLVGKLKQTSISIDSARVEGKDGTLMSVSFTGGGDKDKFKAVQMGGLIGASPFKPNEGGRPSLSISESFVSGTIAATDMKNSDISHISGFVGLYAVADTVKISDSYYKGALTTAMKKPSANKVSGFMAFVAGAKSISVNNSYVYDAEGAASELVSEQDSLTTLPTLTKTKAFMFSSLDYLEDNGDTLDPSSPAFAYKLNEGETNPLWYYDENENDGLPQLVLKADAAKPVGKVTLVGFDESGSSPVDVEIYSDVNGKWELEGNGKRFKDNLDVVSYDSVSKKFVAWKLKDGDILWEGLDLTASKLADGMVFEKQETGVPNVVFNVDTAESKNGTKALFWNNPSYDILADKTLPEVVFECSYNGQTSFYKGVYWTISGEHVLFASSEELFDYIVLNNVTGDVKLEFAADSLHTLMTKKNNGYTGLSALEKDMLDSLVNNEKFETSMQLTNSSGIKIRYTSLGHEREVDFRGNSLILPKVDSLAILDVVNADSATTAYEIGVLGGSVINKELLFNSVLDLTVISLDGGVLTIYQKNRSIENIVPGQDSTVVIDSTGKPVIVPIDSVKPIDPTDPSNPGVPVVDRTDECADSVTIAEARVAKSGTAAQFTVKVEVPASCDAFVKPKVVVSGPNGAIMDSVVANGKMNKFVFYPLNPGEYSFKVKASSKVSKTIKQEFSADIELRGRVWNMVAYGSWPKKALKNAKPTIYTWNESNPIGDYWQYEALPKGAEADEMTGYWVRTESNVEFSLDLPLKVAESDSLSWTVEKKFSGWNMLANPYSWNIYVGSVDGFKSPENGKSPIWRWNTVTAKYEVADTLFANEAFWVKADRKRTLRVSSKPVFPTVKVVKNENKNPLFRNVSKDSWSMVLVASTEDGASDSWNVLGVGSKDISIAEPPAGMESGVTVSFVGEDALLAKRILARTSGDEYSWKVQLKGTNSEKVNLTLEGLDDVRTMGYRAVLVMNGKTYEWGDASTISVDAAGSKTAELKVVPAKAQVALSKGIADMKYSVAAGQIAVNFSVPAEMAGKVAEVRLLDMNGNVLSMARGKAQAGTNDMRMGSVARNGVYVLMVRVGNATRSARIAF